MKQKKSQPTAYQRELQDAARQLMRLAQHSDDKVAALLLNRAAILLRKYAARPPVERVAAAVEDGCFLPTEIRQQTKLSHQIIKISLQYLLTLNKISVRHRRISNKGRPQKLYVPLDNEKRETKD